MLLPMYVLWCFAGIIALFGHPRSLPPTLGLGWEGSCLRIYGLRAIGTVLIFYFSQIKSNERKNLKFVKKQSFLNWKGRFFYYLSGNFTGINEFTKKKVMFCIWITITLFFLIEVSTSQGWSAMKAWTRTRMVAYTSLFHFALSIHPTL